MLATLGAAAGLLLASWGVKALIALSPAGLPRLEMVGIDSSVMLFLLGITVLTSVVFGMAPIMQAGIGNLSAALKEGGRSGTDGVGRGRLRSFLVASEFALAFVLLIGAGLMIRSFVALQAVDAGFNPRNVLSMMVSVAGSKEGDPERREIFYRQLLDKVRSVPGVNSVGAINHLPLAGDLWGYTFRMEGRPKPRPGESPMATYRIVMPGYFETMRLPLRRGRANGYNDDGRAPGVVIINERAAAEYWPGEDPMGKRITFDDDESGRPTWLTVIGVAANAKQSEMSSEAQAEVYLAALQNRTYLTDGKPQRAYITLVVRTAGDPADLAPAVKQAVWSLNRNLAISDVLTMEHVVAEANAQARFVMVLLAVFAGVALLLAAVGIYGVMSYSVSRRTQEIGIRMSLGARPADVLWIVVRQGMTQALAGTVAGITAALLLSKLMAKMLYGVQPTDPVTFTGVAGILVLVALLAAGVPARKATHIEPMAALRSE